MANENLIPFNELTEEEQRELAKKGGIKSGEARRRKKKLKDQFELLLSLPVNTEGKTGSKIKKMAEELGIPKEELDNQMAMCINLFGSAIGRNPIKAFENIQATIGEKPVEKIEITKDTDETIKEIEDYLNKKSDKNE